MHPTTIPDNFKGESDSSQAQSAQHQSSLVEGQGPDNFASTKKRRKVASDLHSTSSNTPSISISKELNPTQKNFVKSHVFKIEMPDGGVKCAYCGKEITSKNIDRWASHLRGCNKTPEDVKAQIQRQPITSSGTVDTNPDVIQMNDPSQNTNVGQASGIPMLTHTTSSYSSSGSFNSQNAYNEVFKVHVSKDYMSFNAAHFIAFKGFREKLHGHNYQLAVIISGSVGTDGYVVDFGVIKEIAKVICKELNESFLVPMNSDALTITFNNTNVNIKTEDGAMFSFPKEDCSLLPIIHSSAEELAVYISNQLIEAFTLTALLERGVQKLEVRLSEATQQLASFERTIVPKPMES